MAELGLIVVAGMALLAGGLIAWSLLAGDPSREHPPGRPYPTAEGEWVQSKGEQLVADGLSRLGVAYRYEPELADGLTPDFHVVGTEVLVEYWGLAGQAGYEERMVEKMEVYEAHGYDVVGLFPTHVDRMDEVLERELGKRGIVAA